MSTNSGSTPRRRHRSAFACQLCRQRKVRCSLSVTGVPCAGCAQDRQQCIVDPKRRDIIPLNRAQVAQNSRQSPSAQRESAPNGNDIVKTSSPAAFGRTEDTIISQQTQIPSPWNSQTSEKGSLSRDDVLEEERHGLEIADAALGQPQRVGQRPFYTGHGLGPTSALDICRPEKSLSRHLLLPSGVSTTVSDEDRQYLRQKKVYNLPGQETCNSLVRAYFHHVHPIIPVIEADVLLNYHTAGRLHEYNLLLLWCVFFVATNFVSPEIYELEGYASRKEMKAAMYSRANCMYNNGGERDQIVLLQASLLMGFWHSEVDEHTQPWYWTGIAVSLCQMLGLHRDPDSSKYNSFISDRQRHLWRRLWWTCFSRDRWLSLTLGRPLRIDLKDCDVPMPTPDDLLSDVEHIPQFTSSSYLPSNLPRLANYWITYVELSRLLGAVLIMNYQTQRPTPTLSQVEDLEAEIMSCKLPNQYEPGLTRTALFYCYHLDLHYQALLITFYRPFGTAIPEGLDPLFQENWNYRMSLRADAAASRTNFIIESIAQDGLLEFAGPMTPPLLVPAMQMHLLRCKNAGPLPRRLRLNKLYTCMIVLGELQRTYTVASIYRAIFAKAIHQIFPNFTTSTLLARSIGDFTADFDDGGGGGTAGGDGGTEMTDAPNPTATATANAAGAGATTTIPMGEELEFNTETADEFINMLMDDEASIFHFWDMNQTIENFPYTGGVV
ncbi:C6 transcription factor, putative [Talaromyces stipitatus ATCC 10500]|uniref:C6 transcription factor, putative n=1 Tax=Talaromyces stipitatus (strain ATCC 10500 / CBS 375.48 / QM 6759 / NRRL 1006) TaxID=441959 RepID=B8MQH5_TALSN|nr:C6 transcription factor, putative [Talaromyces stipitatus ATCC 10500]EED13377.1 C6 transcription factor, putative [Talaromyces stipitatus ATCC 10500]